MGAGQFALVLRLVGELGGQSDPQCVLDGVTLSAAVREVTQVCRWDLDLSAVFPIEERILRQSVGKPLAEAESRALAGEGGAAGVMMIPIPQRGIYHGVEGLAAARSVPGVTGVTMTAQVGQIVAPPPDGASYLGFIFARAFDPAQAEMALRIAHRSLNFDIRPQYPAVTAHEAEMP